MLRVASHHRSLDDVDVDVYVYELDETIGNDIINEDEDKIINYGSMSEGIDKYRILKAFYITFLMKCYYYI